MVDTTGCGGSKRTIKAQKTFLSTKFMIWDRIGQTIVKKKKKKIIIKKKLFHICRFPHLDLIHRSRGQHDMSGHDVGEGKVQKVKVIDQS